MPIPCHQPTRSQRPATNQRFSPPAPTHKPSPSRLRNFADLESSEALHERRDQLLQNYLAYPRKNYRTLPPELYELVSPEHAMCLHPCNARARIGFARIVQQEIVRFGIPMQPPLCWVTLAPGKFAFPLHRAGDFEPRSLMQIVRQALGGIPFLAIVEAGHYRSSRHLDSPVVIGPDLKARRSDMVSWHVHLITWGHTAAQVRAALASFRRRHSSMVGGNCGFVDSIEPNEVAFKMLYASKGQLKSYRHYLEKDVRRDPATGEFSFKVRQSKDWMRTGDHVKMIEVFGRMRLDQLVFGGGMGTDVANVIRYKAMLPFCEWASTEMALHHERRSEFPFVATYRTLGNKLRRKLGDDALGDGPARLRGEPTARRRLSVEQVRSRQRRRT